MAIPDSARTMTFIATRDRPRAIEFYCGLLGFSMTREDESAAVVDLNGAALRIATETDHVAQRHTVLGWEVPDIAATARVLRAKGVAFNVYDGFGQDELGIWNVPGGSAKVAWFTILTAMC